MTDDEITELVLRNGGSQMNAVVDLFDAMAYALDHSSALPKAALVDVLTKMLPQVENRPISAGVFQRVINDLGGDGARERPKLTVIDCGKHGDCD